MDQETPNRTGQEAYRQVRVIFVVGRSQSHVAVVAQSVRGGRRTDHLVHRAVVDPVDVSTVGALLRAMSDVCAEAADRL